MPSHDDRVPPEVESFLIGVFADAGQLGGAIGGGIGGGAAGGAGGRRGGAKGGSWAASRMKTRVEDRAVPRSYAPADAFNRVASALPAVKPLPAPGGGVVRVVVPLGRTGLQQIVVDLLPSGAGTTVRAYGKEGLLSRRPTARTADQVAAAL